MMELCSPQLLHDANRPVPARPLSSQYLKSALAHCPVLVTLLVNTGLKLAADYGTYLDMMP